MKKTIEEKKIEMYRQIEKVLNLSRKTYNRVLTGEEKEKMEVESFGYLLSLYNFGTIDQYKLEKLIYCCVYVASRRKERLGLERTKTIVDLLLFYDTVQYPTKDLLPMLSNIDDYAPFETVN